MIGWRYVGFLKQTTNENATRDFLLASSVGLCAAPYRCYCITALSIPGEGLFLTSSTTFWLIIDDGDNVIDANDNIYLYIKKHVNHPEQEVNLRILHYVNLLCE